VPRLVAGTGEAWPASDSVIGTATELSHGDRAVTEAPVRVSIPRPPRPRDSDSESSLVTRIMIIKMPLSLSPLGPKTRHSSSPWYSVPGPGRRDVS
jgi:hypothetical protein